MKAILLSTKYIKNDYGQRLTFLTEKGEIWETEVKDIYPYIYTDLKEEDLINLPRVNPLYYTIDDRGIGRWNNKVRKIERVKVKHPITHRLIELTKISVSSSYFIKNNDYTGLAQILPKNFIYNENISYADVFIFNRQDVILGMMYNLIGNKDNFSFYLDIDEEKIEQSDINHIKELQSIDKDLYNYMVKIFSVDIPSFKNNILSVDIEIDHDMKVAIDSFNPLYPISSVAFKSEREEICFVLDDETRYIKNSKEDTYGIKKKVIVCKDEKMLIYNTQQYLIHSPEKVIVGYNIDAFDLPYLCNRANIYGIRDPSIWAFKRRDNTIVKGIRNKFLIDLYSFFSNPSIKNYAFKGVYERNSLDSVSNALLGEQKYKYEGEISKLSMYELAFYNLKDVELTHKLCLFDNEIVMRLAIIFQRLGNLTFESVFRRRVSSIVLGMLHNYMYMKNYFLPNKEMLLQIGSGKSEAMIEGKGYKGAIVLEPKKGLFFNVTTLDFASLYPSVADVKNICFSTINCNHVECQDNKVFEVGHHICKLRRGIISEVVGAVKNIRVFYYKKKAKKDSFYKPIEQALKVVINSAYGVFGDQKNYYYAQPIAESITAEARRSILGLIKYAESIGKDVIYGDTDSTFIKDITDEEIEKLIKEMKDNYQLDLGIDYRFKWINIYKKKNYIGMLENGKIDIKGLMGKKRNTPNYIKKCFNKIVDKLKELTEDNLYIIKDEIRKIVHKDYYNLMKMKNVDINDLIIRNVVSKEIDEYTKTTPIHIKASKYLYDYIAKNFKEQVSISTIIPKGTIIEYVKTRKEIGTTALPIEVVKKSDIDRIKYADQLLNVVEQIIEPLGINSSDIINNQSTLTDFF